MSGLVDTERRKIIAAAGGGVLLGVAGTSAVFARREIKELDTVGDLMREHSLLRRALLVYRQTAIKLRQGSAIIDMNALNQTARLFRKFGEDYHEKELEETFVFPVIRKTNGRAAPLADVLQKQHEIGREITNYILSMTNSGTVSQTNELARAFEMLTTMYDNHAAREDTIVFQAWRRALTDKQFEEIGSKFEEIQCAQFGKNGFSDAEKQMSAIEEALGYGDLSQFNAPLPKMGALGENLRSPCPVMPLL